jgi:hypothetical protein
MYKVTYYASNSSSEQSVLFKWFKTADEAFDFSRVMGDRVIETKQYNELQNFPLPKLDMS